MEPLVPRLILVPTDFSAPAAHALRYASSLADRFGAHLLVIYADTFMVPVDFTATAAASFDLPREVMIDEAREQLEGHAEQCISTRVPYEVRVVVDGAVAAIVGQVRETGADLIVMGTHGRTGMRRLLMGSVTEAVIRVAQVPVLSVNPRTPETASFAKVLCPATDTPACEYARRYAASLTNCKVETLPVTSEVEEILGVANATRADLIALEVPTDRTIADSIRGTVVERIVQHSGCPVLTVNAFATRAQPAAERELTAV